MGRRVVIGLVALFLAGFGFLTVQGIVRHGLTFEAVVSVLVLLLLGVGILGAMRNPPGR